MKKTKRYLDINHSTANKKKIVDLRSADFGKLSKPLSNSKKSKPNFKAKEIIKRKDKIFLIANKDTKFSENINYNIDVNFLRNKNRNSKIIPYLKKIISKKLILKRLNNFKIGSRAKYGGVIFSRSLAFFLIIALFSVSTIRGLAYFQGDLLNKKDKIISGAEIAYKYMDSGQQSIMQKDYDLASYKFGVASERFEAAQQELEFIGKSMIDTLSLFPVGKKVSSADYLLEAGSNIAVASEYIAYALMPFNQTGKIFEALEQEKLSSVSNEDGEIAFTDALLITNANLEKSLEKIILAEENLNKVNVKSLPNDIAQQVITIKKQVPQIRYVIEKYLSFSDLILKLLGHDNLKKYLFIFQNNRELRATGGFIGTYGQFDINEGKIENIKIEGPYNVDGQLFDNIAAPEPMRLIVSRLYMRDANWFADFPTSAKKISSLYEKSGQATTDGVIAVTSNLFNDLLKLVGPIDMPEYGKIINYENFYEETQRHVEFEYDKELNEPKKFIADMFPKLIDKFSQIDKDKWPEILNLFITAFEKKDIMIYFQDPSLEKFVKEFGWGGEIVETKKDYLNIISTNIGGGKTDHVINQNTYLNTEIKSDGSVINTLTISRKHMGDVNKLFEDVKNVSFLRFYVPLGSTLLEAEGFDDWFFDALMSPEEGYTVDKDIKEIEENMDVLENSKTRIFKENGKTVFGNWMGVEVGSEKVARIKYKLPFKINLDENNPIKNYSLVLQRQPGSENRKFYGKLNIPEAWKTIWTYNSTGFESNNLEYSSNMDKDEVLGLIFANKNFNL